MSKAAPSSILQAIRVMAEDRSTRERSDRELLGRFVANRDQAAFQALMQRHSPVVLDVCRSMLANQADVEDAFQAVFLVFARKASSIRQTSSIASWLHGVAYRIALKAQAEYSKRKKHEAIAPRRESVSSADDLSWREVKAVVHHELNALPEVFKVVLVHCYLEGKTQDEAALELKLPKGTLKGRLERARALLRERLVRRGLGLGAAVVASAWPVSKSTAVTPALIDSTIRVAAGQAGAGIVSARVVRLTEGAVRAMSISQMKIAMIVIALGVASMGSGAFIHTTSASEERDGVGQPKQATAQPGQDLPKGPAKGAPPQEQSTPDANRAAAEWVIAHGGRIRTAAGSFGKGDSLGTGPFQITGIRMESNSDMTDEDLARFKDLKKLNNLYLAGTPINGAGLKYLSESRSLESLYLPNTNVGNEGLSNLKGMTNLANLYLNETKVTDAGLESLATLKGLSVLYLPGTQITDAGLKHLKTMGQLCCLDLSETRVTDAGMKDLASLTQLQDLELRLTRITDDGLKELAGLKQLRELYLGQTQVSDAGMKYLSRLTNLQKLGLATTGVTDAGLKHLAGLTDLRSLRLDRDGITDDGLKELARLTKLEELWLGLTHVSGAGLKHLASLQQLRTLGLSGTNVTDVGVADLKKLKNLVRLNLEDTKVTQAGIAELKISLPNCQIIAPKRKGKIRPGASATKKDGWVPITSP
jgi:RNA polymerase sigma factor (sigma-70 family)